MDFLQKLQSLPESKRKLILWTVVILIGISLSIFYVKSIKQNLENLKVEEIKKQLKIPEFQEKLKEMPKIEIPEISEEELKELEETMKETEFKR